MKPPVTTETIDRLFLELSQFTKAVTEREMGLIKALRAIEQLSLGPDRPSASYQAEEAHQIAREALRGVPTWAAAS